MKMRKKLAALLAAAMIASVMPMTAFAASTNRVTKPVTVKKDTVLTKAHDVEVVVEMKTGDTVGVGQRFYLELADAEWSTIGAIAKEFGVAGATADAYAANTELQFDIDGKLVGSAGAGTLAYGMVRDSDSDLAIIARVAPLSGNFRIPVLAKITGDSPVLDINPLDSSVSASNFAFAASADGKAVVTVGKVPTIANKDEMASITFDEPFIGAFQQTTDKLGNPVAREIELELRDSDFSFVVEAGAVLKGTKAYAGINVVDDTTSTSPLTADRQTLKITLPALNKTQRGGFVLEGVKVVPNRNAREGEVRATLSGNLVDKKQVVVANYGDYTTSLKMNKDDYSVVAGKELDVKFKLSEEMANALVGNRSVTFTFSKDIIIKDLDGAQYEDGKKLSGGITIDNTNIDLDTSGSNVRNTNTFTIDDLAPVAATKSSYEFEATLYVPAGYTGDISLTAEGRALDGTKEVVVAKTEAPVTVEVKTAVVKVGLQQQDTEAKVIIKETKEDRLAKNGEVRISLTDLGTDGLSFNGADIKVTEGDLELNTDDIVKKGATIIIPIKRHSTVASTIEVANIKIKSDRTVPQGSYGVEVGGSAISDFTSVTHFGGRNAATVIPAGSTTRVLVTPVLDKAIKVEDFIVVGTPNTEDIAGGANKAKVAFVVGASQYLVNGVEQTMDATPYVKDGRTMVPVRYVAAALGVRADQVVWDGANQTATVLADKTIQVKLGSKMMVIDGVSVPMAAAAELKSDRTFVPVAEIARALGVTVAWDATTQTATFN